MRYIGDPEGCGTDSLVQTLQVEQCLQQSYGHSYIEEKYVPDGTTVALQRPSWSRLYGKNFHAFGSLSFFESPITRIFLILCNLEFGSSICHGVWEGCKHGQITQCPNWPIL